MNFSLHFAIKRSKTVETKSSLENIIRDLKKGKFSYHPHALKRMDERQITSADIEFIIAGGLKDRKYREDHDSWNFFGYGMDNEKLTISARYDIETIIVTVF